MFEGIDTFHHWQAPSTSSAIMRSIIVIYLLFMLVVCSSSYNPGRLFKLFHKPMEKEVDLPIAPVDNAQETTESAAPAQSESMERSSLLQTRNDWDSGEDYYFQWAQQNRRPVENLIGRKRAADSSIFAAPSRRIKGGIWRSGLVG